MRRPKPPRALALVAAAALLGTTAPVATAAPPSQAVSSSTRAITDVATEPQPTTDTPALVDGLAEPVDAGLAPDKAAKAHLAGHQDRYKIADAAGTLVTESVDREGPRETVRLNQEYEGLPVFGAQYVVRMEKKAGKRTVTGTSGSYFTDLDVDTTAARLTAEQAVTRAVESVRKSLRPGAAVVAGGQRPGIRPGTESAEGSGLTGRDKGLAVVPSGTGVLTRHVVVSGADAGGLPVSRDVYVNASTGTTLLSVSRIKTFAAAPPVGVPAGDTAPQGVSEPAPSGTGVTPVVGEGTRLDGTTVPLGLQRVDAAGLYFTMDTSHRLPDGRTVPVTTWDARAQDYYTLMGGQWPEGMQPFMTSSSTLGADLTDAGAVDAAWSAAEVFEYWQTELGRDSLDGDGMAINSLVGITYGGNPWANAYWDGTRMVYGIGDAEYLPMAADLDVVGHEMTHGVVEHSANLVYAGQQGALNEAVADYFGNAIDVDASGQSMSDPGASLLGGDLCRSLAPTECALRDLDDGATTADFQHLLDTPQMDEGGVHLNSTIVSGALWDLRQAFGGTVADKIVYRALTDYLTPLSDFVDAREAVIASATSFGLKGKDLTTVKKAFDSRGITAKWEERLYAKGTTPLVDRLNTGMYADYQASTADGWFAVPRATVRGEAPTIWVGRTDGSIEPYQVSEIDGSSPGFARTDGERVVWKTFELTDESPTGEVNRILSAPIEGGPVRELYRTEWPINGLGMDGDVVAWSELDSEQWLDVVHYLEGDSPTVHTIEHDWFGPATAPAVEDGRISYVRYEVIPHEEGSGWDWSLGVEVYDVATGATVLAGSDPMSESMSYPSLSSAGVAWVTNLDYGSWTPEEGYSKGTFYDSVRLYDFATGTSRLLFEENSPDAVRAFTLTLSDSTLTTTEEVSEEIWFETGGYPDNRLNPKLKQYSFEGEYVGPASCSPGAQVFATAGEGREVIYMDSSAGGLGLAIAQGATSCK